MDTPHHTPDPTEQLTPAPTEHPAYDVSGDVLPRKRGPEDGLATAEYGIVMLAAVAFAGLLTVVLTSDTVQGLLEGIVTRALGS